MTDKLFALSIGTTPIERPGQIPEGGLDKAFASGSNLIALVFVIVTALALGYLIWGGIKWITSGGDKSKIQGARSTIIYALIGLVVIFLSFFIVNVVTTIFNTPSVSNLFI